MKNKDYGISLARFLATVFIIMCHFMSAPSINLGKLALWFNVGVQMFLYISGYLYGKKNIKTVEFYKNNFKKILVDYYLFVIPALAFIILTGMREVSGTDVISLMVLTGQIPGLLHLWFVPYILFCYIITPIFKDICESIGEKSLKNIVFTLMILLPILQFIGDFFVRSFNPIWINCYILGLLYSIIEEKDSLKYNHLKRITYIMALILNCVQIAIDHVIGYQFGNEWFIQLYKRWCNYAHVFLAISIVLLTKQLLQIWVRNCNNLSAGQIVRKPSRITW